MEQLDDAESGADTRGARTLLTVLFCGSRSRSTSADRALAESARSIQQRNEVGLAEESNRTENCVTYGTNQSLAEHNAVLDTLDNGGQLAANPES